MLNIMNVLVSIPDGKLQGNYGHFKRNLQFLRREVGFRVRQDSTSQTDAFSTQQQGSNTNLKKNDGVIRLKTLVLV